MTGATSNAAAGEVVFQATGSGTTGQGLWFLIVFGVIGALTMIIVSIAGLPVGPWWLWLLAIVPFVQLARWEMRSSAVEVELVREGERLRLRVRGRGARPAIDGVLAPAYEHWATSFRVPIRQGGGTMTHFSLVVVAGDRKVGFHQMGGADTYGWPERAPRLADGQDVFSIANIFSLEKALRR
jgi:hypothetical protein